MFVINATDYAPIDPLTPPCDVNQINIGYVGENHARCLVFDLTECVAQFGEGGFAISFIRHGDYLPYLVTDTDRLENNAIWLINSTDTAVEGYGMVQLQYIVGTTVVKSALYQTVTFASNQIPGNVPDPYEDLLTQIAAYAAQAEGAATTATAAAQAASTAVEDGIKTERSQRIAADNGLQLQITELMGLAGAPSMAATAAAMTDSSKVYVYTGNEAGYINGNWYYYNGTEWVSGGVYQATAVNTDKTLTVSDMAADAAVVGDRIDECMAAFVTEQTSGSVASFDDGADNVPLKDLVVNITPKQAGTGDPSPSNVRAISGWTGANISRTGKNLLTNLPRDIGTFSGVTVSVNANGQIVLNGTCTANNNARIGSCTLPAGSYVFTGMTTTGSSSTHFLNITPQWNGTGNQNLYSGYYSGTTTEEITFTVRLYFRSGASFTNTIYEPMIRVASDTDATFEPYMGNAYNISFGTAGTVYGGTLNVTTGMLTVNTVGRTFDGTESWSQQYTAPNRLFRYTFSGLRTDGTEILRRACSHFSNIGITSSTIGIGFYAYTSGSNNNIWFQFRPDLEAIPDLEAWKAWLAQQYSNGTPLQAFTPIITPVSYQLSPTEVKTILGQNNIWSDTGDITNLEYRADTKLYIEHLTTPGGDMVADSNIANGSYFMVNNRLYIATAAIASGASIVPGTNCTETNLAAALNAINA